MEILFVIVAIIYTFAAAFKRTTPAARTGDRPAGLNSLQGFFYGHDKKNTKNRIKYLHSTKNRIIFAVFN